MLRETINSQEDILLMLDSLLREPAPFWDDFYSDREKGAPFFVNKPDENLADYFEKGLLAPGKVLELGCGPGRNAVYFAGKGCTVDAVDLSEEAIQWASDRAEEHNADIHFIHDNIFNLAIEEGAYDIVYDSGCFHHIAPHRRMNYLCLVQNALKPGGYFALTCFVENGELGGTEMSDWDVYRIRSLQGGLGFTDMKLRNIFKDFEEIEIRKMREMEPDEEVFGVPGFYTALFRKK